MFFSSNKFLMKNYTLELKFVGPLKSFANCRYHVKQPRVGIVKKVFYQKKLHLTKFSKVNYLRLV